MAFATGVFEVDTMANVELDYLLRLGASDGLPRSRSIEASRRPRLGPTMAFATGVFEVDTMANVELDYSIDQERAICPQGLFFLKYGFFRVLPLLITRGRLLRDATRDEDESYYCSRQKRRCKLHSQSPLSER
jgi:hypothetical protein